MSRRVAPLAGGILDVVAVLGLVVLAVLPLRTTYAGHGWLVTALAAAGCGVLLVVVTLRAPLAVTVSAIPIGWLLLGGPVGLHSAGAGLGVPDARTLADVMAGTWTGWGEMLTTLPPVDVTGPPAMVPFLIGYVAAGVATALALRGRSPGIPAVPLVLAVAVGLAMGRPGATTVVAVPVGAAALVLGWMVLRGARAGARGLGRGAPVPGSSRGWVLRGLAALVVVALATGVAAAYVGRSATLESGTTLRGHVGTLPDVTELDRPLARFRTFTAQRRSVRDNLNRALLFRVHGVGEGERVRLVTLDRYDGHQWLPGNDTVAGADDDRFLRMDSTVETHVRGRRVRGEVEVGPAYQGSWVPTVGVLTSLSFRYTDADLRRGQLRYDPATGSAEVPIGLGDRNDYRFTAIVPPDGLNPSMAPWPTRVLDLTGLARVSRFAVAWGGTGPPMQRVYAIAHYLRDNGRYSDGAGLDGLRYQPGHDLGRLLRHFLGAPQMVGDDEQYAAAMALLANATGVPARVVVGAVLPADGDIHGRDMQAWVEVRISDGSWRVLPTEEFMSHRPPDDSYRQPPLPPAPSKKQRQADQQQAQPQPQQHPRHRDPAGPGTPTAWLWLLLVPLAVALVPVAKAARRRRRRTRGRPSDRMAAAWLELLDQARDLGIRVPAGAPRPAQERLLVGVRGDGVLARAADDGVFAAREPDEDAVTAYWAQVERERRRLRDHAPPWRRLLAPVHPASLRPGRGRPRPPSLD